MGTSGKALGISSRLGFSGPLYSPYKLQSESKIDEQVKQYYKVWL